ncbi:hypothetical protein [Yersinia sp. 1652 StPb PI]|uniref:hypothetical protein n=1 Tax=Yersinia sp. 1652 StPb PI TaxID=3061649 RepID=UPI00355B4C3E
MKYFLFTFWLAFIASPSLAQGLSGTIELILTIVPSCQVQSPNQNEHIANDAKVNYPQIHCQRGGGLVSEPKISHSFIATDGSLLSQTSNSQMTQLITVEW